ncbi:Uma2 family endonuclease [Nostoc commune]|uniref:Uma2 family endonuclease n=1 Tax=Nostoc commune TaxID=1178 RepID=UPI0018C7E6E7|nr:Uma2 family endonuclease [Nostoc commune]MBG1258356.1 Uma2 family endonuclease [Nostoc commune BAE]
MTLSANQLKTEIIYPSSDGKPMAESDPARDYLIYAVEALDIYFQDRNDVYVSGNLFVYYKKSIPSAVVAPDVFVVFEVAKRKRVSYKVWEEGGKVPNFILEITSASTQENDEEDKPKKYSLLGVQEYFQYDPTGDYLNPQLKGSYLFEGKYQPITSKFLPDGVSSIHSEALGLDLRLINGELRFFDPQTGKKLLSHKETEQARQQAEQARQDAIPRLLQLGLSVEQIASTLSLSLEEVVFSATLDLTSRMYLE